MTTPALPKPSLLTRSLPLLIGLCGILACLSGMVLLLQGHMGLVMPAVMLATFGQLLFPFILLPASMMAGLWHALHAHGAKLLVRFFAVASVAYIAAIMSATLWLQAHLMTRLPAGEPPFFVGMFLVTGALAPWTIFALRDRYNQLFIVMLWAMLGGALVALPLFLTGAATPFIYALCVWLVMLLVLFIENLRQTRHADKAAAAAAVESEDAVAPEAEES